MRSSLLVAFKATISPGFWSIPLKTTAVAPAAMTEWMKYPSIDIGSWINVSQSVRPEIIAGMKWNESVLTFEFKI
jgi:hypothetical protein